MKNFVLKLFFGVSTENTYNFVGFISEINLFTLHVNLTKLTNVEFGNDVEFLRELQSIA